MPRRTQSLGRRAESKARVAATIENETRPTQAIQKLSNAVTRAETRSSELAEALETATSTSERAGRDVMAMTLSQGFNEVANLFIRWAAEQAIRDGKEPTFWYRNVDLLQALPGALGLATYLINTLALHSTAKEARDKQQIYLPPGWRLTLNESAKLLTTLGLSNVFRALRYRWGEAIDEGHETDAALRAQRETLAKAREEIARLQARLRVMEGGGK